MSRSLLFAVSLSPSANTTPAKAQELADAFRAAFPTGRMTWAFNDVCMTDAAYQGLRDYVATQVAQHGDAAAYWMGFPSNLRTVAASQAMMDTYLPRVMQVSGYSTPCVMSWHMPAALIAYARTRYNVRTVVAQVWSQTGVDSFSGDGSPNCPYYPSASNTLIPAQAEANRIDAVLLDSISQGLWEAQTDGHNGRITVHPVDCVTLARAQSIAAEYLTFPDPLKYVTNTVELDWINDTTSGDARVVSGGQLVAKKRLLDWLAWLPTSYPDLQAVTVPQFGDAWRAAHPTNDFAVAQSGANPADATQRVYWNYTAQRRVAVRKDGSTLKSLDWATYSDATGESTAPATVWNLPQQLSQKATVQVSNPSAVMSYRDLADLYGGHPDLLTFRR